MAALEHHIVNYEWAHIKHTKARSVGTWEFLSLLFFLIRLHSQRVGWVFGIPASMAALERLIVGRECTYIMEKRQKSEVK